MLQQAARTPNNVALVQESGVGVRLGGGGLLSSPASSPVLSHRAASTSTPTPVLPPTRKLTYTQLDAQSARLAKKIQHVVGVGGKVSSDVSGGEFVVGILMDRSIELAVSMLAVMRAGGAMVTLDIAHPLSRNTFQLTNTNTNVVITKQQYKNEAAALKVQHVIYVDAQDEEISGDIVKLDVKGMVMMVVVLLLCCSCLVLFGGVAVVQWRVVDFVLVVLRELNVLNGY